jgi:thiol-disulfide isomerase/thioredoxin
MSMRSIAPVLTAALMVLMSLNGLMDFSEPATETENELLEVTAPSFATSPGHIVFAEYVGADWCPPCQNGGSPSMHALKSNFGAEFTYLSYFESGGSYPPDPLNRRSHVMAASTGIPTASFGDADSGTYHPAGAGTGTTAYDSQFSSGGDMKNVNDYTIGLTQTVNGANMDIDITATYLGTSPSVTVYVLAAITEETSPDTYDDGTTHPHNVIKKFLLTSGNTGFRSLQLTPNTPVTTSWSEPVSTARAYGSASSAQNFNTVAALMNGPHSTYNDVFVAVDATMNPLDLSVADLTITNDDATYDGFLTGDMLSLESTVANTGTADYSDGGNIQFFHVEGSTETAIGPSVSLNALSVGQSQTINAQFDTSSISMDPNGLESFRVRLSNTVGEADPVSNNRFDAWVNHDFSPSTDTPLAAGQTSIPRGGSLDFDVSGNARDNIDTMTTMTAEFEVSPAGLDAWDSSWVTAPSSVTAPGTQYERYVFSVDPVQTAGSGDYDVRARLLDSREQPSDWAMGEDAFSLVNGLPIVVDPSNPDNTPADCPTYPGMPTVKVDTDERVDLAGLICDAETDLSQLLITSNDPAFLAYHADSGEVEVHFASMQWDSLGNPLSQGIGVSIDDGEDTNTGTLQFNVVENGQPRWSSVPAQSYDEGGSVQVPLAQHLSDTDANGNPTSVTNLNVNVVSIEPAGILDAEIYGHTLSINSVDADAFGSVVITVRATDADGQLSETAVHVHVQNINDAPRLNLTGLENLMVQVDQPIEIDLSLRLTDIDDDDAEIWATAQSSTPGAAQYNPISGLLTATYDSAGQQIITISAADSHGEEGTWQLIIDVVDTLPLEWSLDGSTGDIDIVVTDMHYGEDPTVFVVQLSDLELNEITLVWSVCNLQSGICSDFGEESVDSTTLSAGHSFTVALASGTGLQNYDQLKVHVEAIDNSGFDRESTAVPYDAAESPDPVDETPTDEDENTGAGTEENSAAGGMSGAVLGALIGLIVLVIAAGVLAAMLLRGGRKENEASVVDWGTEAAFAAPGSAMAPAMMAPAAAPVAEVVSDYTHLPVGGQYITGHAGETVYLAPNGTAWTMRSDNSFVRSA